MDGVFKFATPRADGLVVTYDDEKTNPAILMEALNKGGIRTTDNPASLK
jgi:hypothetical protein